MPLKNLSPLLSSNWEKLNYYELLNISPDASPAEIEQAYLHLKNSILIKLKNSEASPSFNLQEAEKIIARIDEAWRTLSDPQKRKIYQARLFPNKQIITTRGFSRRSLTPLIIEPVHPRSRVMTRLKAWLQKFKKH